MKSLSAFIKRCIYVLADICTYCKFLNVDACCHALTLKPFSNTFLHFYLMSCCSILPFLTSNTPSKCFLFFFTAVKNILYEKLAFSFWKDLKERRFLCLSIHYITNSMRVCRSLEWIEFPRSKKSCVLLCGKKKQTISIVQVALS